MSNISQYLSDHSAAGQCAKAYYENTHTAAGCTLTPGVCSVIAYLVVELKNAEYRASITPAPFMPVTPMPVAPVPPVTTAGDNGNMYLRPGDGTLQGGGGSGGTGLPIWDDTVEKR